jgi:hypothetical protein
MFFLPATIKGQHGVTCATCSFKGTCLISHYEGHTYMSDFRNPRRKGKINTITTRLIFFVMSTMYAHYAYS